MRQYVATYFTFAQNQDQHGSILYHYFAANDTKLPGFFFKKFIQPCLISSNKKVRCKVDVLQ